MVSPRTSARYNPSSTSLSFSGRMIAKMSFILSASLRANEDCAFAPVVCLFTVLGDVHADSFFLLTRAQRRDHCYELQNHERADHAIDNRSQHRRDLNAELLRISEKRAIGGVVPDLLRQHTGEQRSYGSADSVRGDHVERIVESGSRSPENREIAGDGGDGAEHDPRHRTHEARRWCDCDKA